MEDTRKRSAPEAGVEGEEGRARNANASAKRVARFGRPVRSGTGHWPAREAIITASGVDGNKHICFLAHKALLAAVELLDAAEDAAIDVGDSEVWQTMEKVQEEIFGELQLASAAATAGNGIEAWARVSGAMPRTGEMLALIKPASRSAPAL